MNRLAGFVGFFVIVVGCQATFPPTPSPSPAPTARAAEPWTSLTWRQLDRADPLAAFIGVVGTPAGYFAWGEPVATDLGLHSPLWTSTDGRGWRELPASTFGSTGSVINVYPFRGRLTGLTVGGDESICSDTSLTECWTTRAPVRAWTSADGVAWTQQAEPMSLVDNPERRDPVSPLSAATSAWMVVTVRDGDGAHLAVSADGVTWQTSLPPPAFVEGTVTGMASISKRFVAIGSPIDQVTEHADFASWSEDGVVWEPATEFSGTSAGLEFRGTGAGGVIALGGQATSFGWWTSQDGDHWSFDPSFGPLGRPKPGAAMPSGDVAGDGERLIAYSFEQARLWQSFDASSWTELTGEGVTPKALSDPRGIRVLPIGVLVNAGADVWFGDPAR